MNTYPKYFKTPSGNAIIKVLNTTVYVTIANKRAYTKTTLPAERLAQRFVAPNYVPATETEFTTALENIPPLD